MIQAYGNYSSWASADRVCREILWQLWGRRFPVSGVKGIDTNTSHLQVDYVDIPPNYRENVNNAAKIGLIYGTVEKSFMWLRGHKEKLLYAFCETDRIPQAWLPYLNIMTQIFVPSQFCKTAFEESGVKTPIEIVLHGVSEEFFPPTKPAAKRDEIRILHVSGAMSYPQRKGLPQVLLAFAQLTKKHPQLKLILQAHRTRMLTQALQELRIEAQTQFVPFAGLEPEQQAQLYRSVDLVLQPSRGEAFGMVPLEARACGTPVALTLAHGHLEHAEPTVDIEVATGPLRHMETQGNDRGRAPEVSVASVHGAIEKYLKNSGIYKAKAIKWAQAEQKTRKWSWERVLSPLLKNIKTRLRRQPTVLGEHVGLVGADDDI